MIQRSDDRPTTPTVVSLFSGAGGLDYGFEAAGFETRLSLEMDEDCCRSIQRNRKWPLIEDRVENVTSTHMLEVASLRPGEVDLLIGGPPCQPFSKSSYWTNGDTKRMKDPRANTLSEYMRCVNDLLPRAFLLENVHGISYTGKEEGFLHLYELMESINERQGTRYRLSWKVLNAADYGVPQLRSRFFLVGSRDGKSFAFPRASHSEHGSELLFGDDNQPAPYATAWDAIGGLEGDEDEDLQMRGQWKDLLPSIPEGENYLWHTDRKGGLPLFGWRTRYWSFLLKLAKNRPSWTIQAQPGPAIGPFHWDNRLLSWREMAAIQTFPEDVAFYGNRISVQRQLGNAVPSLLAEVLARDIGSQLLNWKPSSELRLSTRPRRPIPPPTPTQSVPKQFLSLVGKHDPHPGTGKGRGALRMQGNEPPALLEAQ